MSTPEQFDRVFYALTGNWPFPWQRELSRRFIAGDFPKSCNLPTGLGKTSVIPIWMLTLAADPTAVPRRLVYVVNRRTVVDQATCEAERMREALGAKVELQDVAAALRSLSAFSDAPLAISTIRGQFADNAEWRNDPARPAVIVGTVDMIGSRLLFAGYGCGFKSRPLHAGFLGQDTLLVHDEAHLEPAFQELITAIEAEQQRCREFRRFRVMSLTATSRSDAAPFQLTDADREHSVVQRRIEAKKWIAFRPIDDEKKLADEVAPRALNHRASGRTILIFLRRLDDVQKVAEKLRKEKQAVQLLTGTLRGLERDALATEDDIFVRFMPPSKKSNVTPRSGTVYLICTSAGEVGVDISADHLVCDLTPFDSMAQRFGRVNRFGEGDAYIDIVHEGTPNEKEKDDRYGQARWKTLELLRSLPQNADDRFNASPAALGNLPVDQRQAAFTPAPVILPVSDILFDAWALTSIRQKLPGRPPVADWLHGVAEWEPPETHVAWREEVECLSGDLLARYTPEDLLEDYPLKPHELLRDSTDRVFKELETLATRHGASTVWIVADDQPVTLTTLAELAAAGKNRLNHLTVLLPPSIGGLGFDASGRSMGLLDGDASFNEASRESYDVSAEWKDHNDVRRRCRRWDDEKPPEGMRLVRTIDTRPDTDEEPEEDEQTPRRRHWYWWVRPRSADDDGSGAATEPQRLDCHLGLAETFARGVVAKLPLQDGERKAVTLAARWHDLGKKRAVWQRSIGNRNYSPSDPKRIFAKSGRSGRLLDLNDYRHEFGSLIDLENGKDPEFRQLAPDVRELALHIIAAHHGRARPHFPAGEAFDPERQESEAVDIAREVPRRFARLQRKYGRWGLAYLESLVRAADALASQVAEAQTAEPVATLVREKTR